jgi:hypothetical protein
MAPGRALAAQRRLQALADPFVTDLQSQLGTGDATSSTPVR